MVAQNLLLLKFNAGGLTPISPRNSSSEILSTPHAAPSNIQTGESSLQFAEMKCSSSDVSSKSPVLIPEPVESTAPPPGLASSNLQMRVSLQPTLPFSLITLSRQELAAFTQHSTHVKRPRAIASNHVRTLQPKQDPSNQGSDCVRVKRTVHELDAMPVAQLVSPENGQPAGYLIPTEVNTLDAPNAILLPAPSQDKNGQSLYSINIPLQDSRVCYKQSLCRRVSRNSSRLQLGERLLVLQVDLGSIALLITRTTAIALRSALRSALGSTLRSALGALEVSAVVRASLARDEVVGVLHRLEGEDHLGLFLLFLLLLALLLLVLVALRLRLTPLRDAYHEVVVLLSLQLLALHGLHGTSRLLAQQLAHLGLALLLVLLQREHHLRLSSASFHYGLGLSSNLFLLDGGLLDELRLILPTRDPLQSDRTDGPWHPWGCHSFCGPIRSWGSHGYVHQTLQAFLTHDPFRCGDRTHAFQGAYFQH